MQTIPIYGIGVKKIRQLLDESVEPREFCFMFLNVGHVGMLIETIQEKEIGR